MLKGPPAELSIKVVYCRYRFVCLQLVSHLYLTLAFQDMHLLYTKLLVEVTLIPIVTLIIINLIFYFQRFLVS